jgi:hypothetical protein
MIAVGTICNATVLASQEVVGKGAHLVAIAAEKESPLGGLFGCRVKEYPWLIAEQDILSRER